MKLPDNNSRALFLCTKEKDCAYRTPRQDGCLYREEMNGIALCKSNVAIVNRCVLEIQKRTGLKVKVGGEQ